MSRFGFVTGCALIVLGAVVGIYGSPYYMLDWGGTLVLSGLGMAACGLVLLFLSAILRQLQVMTERLEARAGAPLAVRADPPMEATVPVPAPVPEPVPLAASEPAPSATAAVPTAVVAAGAAVAAGGLATAAANILNSVSSSGERPAEPVEPAPPTPIRDDLFGKVEQAVRALKDEAGQTQPVAEEAAAQEDLAGLRADLLAGDAPSPEQEEEPSHDKGVEGPPVGAGPDAAAAAQAEIAVPAASEEGVIAAYTVGDSSYTMFADGRIRADTPDGELRFGNMDALKEHMAKRRMDG